MSERAIHCVFVAGDACSLFLLFLAFVVFLRAGMFSRNGVLPFWSRRVNVAAMATTISLPASGGLVVIDSERGFVRLMNGPASVGVRLLPEEARRVATALNIEADWVERERERDARG